MKSIHHWIHWTPLGIFTVPLFILYNNKIDISNIVNQGCVMGLEYVLITLLWYIFL